MPPRIRGSSKAPRKVSVIEAGETVLECEATGRPAPTVMWLKDGQPVVLGDGLSLSEQGWRLRIAQAALVHAGRYVCLAANTAGQERREFDVAVHGEGGGHGGGLRGRDTGSWAGWGCPTTCPKHHEPGEEENMEQVWITQRMKGLGTGGGALGEEAAEVAPSACSSGFFPG